MSTWRERPSSRRCQTRSATPPTRSCSAETARVCSAFRRAAAARQALACTAAFVVEVYGLELRVAEVPVAAIRAAGFDIRIARFAASPDLNYAMFSGGGLAWAETRMKAGEFSIPPGPLGTGDEITLDEVERINI